MHTVYVTKSIRDYSCNLITEERVPTEISHDLLNARTIGQADYKATVTKYSFQRIPV